jgi:hypothetical protein
MSRLYSVFTGRAVGPMHLFLPARHRIKKKTPLRLRYPADQLFGQPATGHSNVRPVVPLGCTGKETHVLWMHGDYVNDTNDETGINIEVPETGRGAYANPGSSNSIRGMRFFSWQHEDESNILS